MRKFFWLTVILGLLIAGTASAEEKMVRYSEWKGHPVELAIDMGYVEVRVRFDSKKEMTDKDACADFLKQESKRLASGKLIELKDGFTFQFKGGSPLEGIGEGTGHDYYTRTLVFGLEAEVSGKSITAKGQ